MNFVYFFFFGTYVLCYLRILRLVVCTSVHLCGSQMEYLDAHPEVAVVGSHVEVFGSCTKRFTIFLCAFSGLQCENSKIRPPSANIGTNDSGGEDVKVITHPVTPAMVEWSMFFFCCMAHPTVGSSDAGGDWSV